MQIQEESIESLIIELDLAQEMKFFDQMNNTIEKVLNHSAFISESLDFQLKALEILNKCLLSMMQSSRFSAKDIMDNMSKIEAFFSFYDENEEKIKAIKTNFQSIKLTLFKSAAESAYVTQQYVTAKDFLTKYTLLLNKLSLTQALNIEHVEKLVDAYVKLADIEQKLHSNTIIIKKRYNEALSLLVNLKEYSGADQNKIDNQATVIRDMLRAMDRQENPLLDAILKVSPSNSVQDIYTEEQVVELLRQGIEQYLSSNKKGMLFIKPNDQVLSSMEAIRKQLVEFCKSTIDENMVNELIKIVSDRVYILDMCRDYFINLYQQISVASAPSQSCTYGKLGMSGIVDINAKPKRVVEAETDKTREQTNDTKRQKVVSEAILSTVPIKPDYGDLTRKPTTELLQIESTLNENRAVLAKNMIQKILQLQNQIVEVDRKLEQKYTP